MSLKEEYDDTLKNFDKAVEIGKKKIREFLMTKSKEDRFKVLRENFSQKEIELMCEWAIPEEEYEICSSVEEVKANNISQFKIRFVFEEENNNKALIVKFKGTGDRTYYHADYLLHDNERGTMLNLHKNDEGIWTSEWSSNDDRLFIPIGNAIDEKKQ